MSHEIRTPLNGTIGENDPDSMAILPTDRPVIPNGHENDAPILKLIEVKKKKYGKL
jgi:signal transduction histidine kinase